MPPRADFSVCTTWGVRGKNLYLTRPAAASGSNIRRSSARCASSRTCSTPPRGFLHVSDHALGKQVVRVHKQGDHFGLRNQLREAARAGRTRAGIRGTRLARLGHQLDGDVTEDRGVAARPGETTRPAQTGIDMEECDALKRRWVGVGEIPDGDRWDSPPKIRFAPDSPLEGTDLPPMIKQKKRGGNPA